MSTFLPVSQREHSFKLLQTATGLKRKFTALCKQVVLHREFDTKGELPPLEQMLAEALAGFKRIDKALGELHEDYKVSDELPVRDKFPIKFEVIWEGTIKFTGENPIARYEHFASLIEKLKERDQGFYSVMRVNAFFSEERPGKRGEKKIALLAPALDWVPYSTREVFDVLLADSSVWLPTTVDDLLELAIEACSREIDGKQYPWSHSRILIRGMQYGAPNRVPSFSMPDLKPRHQAYPIDFCVLNHPVKDHHLFLVEKR